MVKEGVIMQETLIETQVSEIQLSAVMFNGGFKMGKYGAPQNIIEQITYLHTHSAFEIFFVFDGNLTVVCDDARKVYCNSVVIIPPHFNHYTVSNVKNGYATYFTISPTSNNESSYKLLNDILKKGITTIPLGENELFYATRLNEVCANSCESDDIVHLISLLFSCIIKKLVPPAQNEKDVQNKHQIYISIIEQYISTHANERIVLSDIAKELFLCPKQVARIIKKEYGCTLSELINRKKLSCACMLLKYTSLNINDISATVGYEHPNYFYTLFRKTYGVTPHQYREEQ